MSIIVVTDDMKLKSARVLTARIREFSPECRGYVTVCQIDAVARNYKLNRNQLLLIPFPHSCKGVTEEHFMMANLPGADAVFHELQQTYPTGSTEAHAEHTGDFSISLVPTFTDLVGRVDWSAFGLAGNFAAVMRDTKSRYGTGYGFVIATPTVDMTNGRISGTFGWVWYGARAMVPTAAHLDAWVVNDHVQSMRWSDAAKSTFTSWKLHPSQSNSALQALLDAGRLHRPDGSEQSKPLGVHDIVQVVSAHLSDASAYYIETVPGLAPVPNLTPAKSILKHTPPLRGYGLQIALGVVLLAFAAWVVVVVFQNQTARTQ